MAKASITKRTVDAAKPERAEYIVWDDGGKETVKGFGLKVMPSGNKVYLYRYRLARPGQLAREVAPRTYTIGRHGEWTPDQARTRAGELARMVAEGIDPRQAELDKAAASEAAKQAAARQAHIDSELVFEKCAARWLKEYATDHRPSSIEAATTTVNKHLTPLNGKPLPSITPDDLKAILRRIPASQTATRRNTYAYANIFFGWAIHDDDIALAENPLLKVPKPPVPKARKRVLTDAELADVWNGAAKLLAPLDGYFHNLILTGKRRDEVAKLDWQELDRATATWIIPGTRTKNGEDDVVHLSPPMVEMLDRIALALQVAERKNLIEPERWPKRGPVFTTDGKTAIGGYSKAKAALDAEITKLRAERGETEPMAAWRVHDLRRTFATGFQRLGIRLEVTEAALNHVSGSKAGVVGIYQTHEWRDEKRGALDAWARHVATILAPADSCNVVTLSAGKKSAWK